MKTTMNRLMLTGILFLVILFGFISFATGDWGPPETNVPPQQQYPQQQYPQQQYPQVNQPLDAPSGIAQSFRDVFGRFSVNLPSGTVPVGATYNFNIPSSMCQVSIMVMPQEQTFQMQQQNFPYMMEQMGATIDADQQTNVKGRQARFIAATMIDENTGMSTHSMNVFVSGPGLWIQIMGYEQNMQQIKQVYSAVMSGLQF